MKIICQQFRTHIFLNIAPGLGKTKLILATAINLAQTTQFPVFVLNSSKTLCDRDFQEATFSLEELKIPFASVISQKAKITFSTTQDFIDYKEDLPKNYHILLDEYQNIFFKEKKFFEFVEILKLSESFVGFSGSPLNYTQKKLLKYSFDNHGLLLQLTPPTDLGDQETVVCKTQTQLINELCFIADKFRPETPQVFILDPQTAATLIKGRKKQPYVSLIDKEVSTVNNILSELFNKPNDDGQYGTYIINEEMGTGTDFKTSADIESKGGLVLVFGIKPTNTSTFEQLSCRVGRIFNKSRRFYIINDAAYVGPSQNYLKYQLKILKQKECEEARALLSKFKPNKNNENDPEDEEQTQSIFSDKISEDSPMQDVVQIQDSCSKITQNGESYSENENSSSVYMENDKSFDGKGLEIKVKQSYKVQQDQIRSEGSKKRAIKEQDKFNLQQKRFQQQQKEENEECKVCGDAYIDPHFCLKNKMNTQSEVHTSIIIQSAQVCGIKLSSDGVVFDPNIFLKGNSHSDLNQTSIDQSVAQSRKGSEIAFQHDYLPENIEESSPKFDNQLQKRNKDAKKTELLEQKVRKSLQDQAEAVTQKTQSEFADVMYFSGYSKSGSHENNEEQMKRKKSARLRVKPTVDYDDLYFRSYEAEEVHEEMLNDKVRMNVYQQSINETCQGQIVIDAGAGTGVLSIFAAEAGASHVYGIENTGMIEKAKEKISQSDYINKITLIKGKAEDVDLGQIKADVIVSEWMGYFLLFENMLPSVLSVRDRYLKEDGIMLPKRTSIHFAAMNKKCEDAEKCKDTVIVGQCEQEFLLSTSRQIFNFDLETNKMYAQKGFTSTFELVMLEDCLMTGFVAWFDAAMTDTITLSTSPQQPLTHWKQTLFYLPKVIEVQKGTKIAGKVVVGHQKENSRALWFTISYKTQTMKKSRSVSYSMN